MRYECGGSSNGGLVSEMNDEVMLMASDEGGGDDDGDADGGDKGEFWRRMFEAESHHVHARRDKLADESARQQEEETNAEVSVLEHLMRGIESGEAAEAFRGASTRLRPHAAVCEVFECTLEDLVADSTGRRRPLLAQDLTMQRYGILGALRLPEFDPSMMTFRDSAGHAQRCIWRLVRPGSNEEARVLRLSVHFMYRHCVDMRAAFRRAIGEELRAFAHRTSWREATAAAAGVAMLLEIVAAVADGFSFGFNGAHAGLLRDVLLPLHLSNVMFDDVECLVGVYHAQLVRAVLAVIRRPGAGAAAAMETMQFLVTRAWPSGFDSCTAKEVLLLQEVRDILSFDNGQGASAPRLPASSHSTSSSLRLLQAAMPILLKCASSEHARVLEKAVEVLSCDRVYAMCVGSDARMRQRYLPLLIRALLAGGKVHWSRTVNEARYRLLCKLQEDFHSDFRACCEDALGGAPGNKACGALTPAPSTSDFRETRAPLPYNAAAVATSVPPAPAPLPPRPTEPPSFLSSGYPKRSLAGPEFGLSTASPSYALNSGGGVAPMRGVSSAAGGWQPTKAPFARSSAGRMPTSSTSFAAGGTSRLSSCSAPPRFPSSSVAPRVAFAKRAAHGLPSIMQEDADEGAEIDDARLTRSTGGDGDDCADRPHESLTEAPGSTAARFMERLHAVAVGPESGACSPSVTTGLHSWTFTRLPNLILQDLVFGDDIGSGAFSVVRYAKHVKSKSPSSLWPEYAVKQISATTIREHRYTRSVQREIAIMTNLLHPNIARMVASFRWRDSYYLILEYASMGDLHSMIQSMGSLDVGATRFWMAEVLSSLRYLHSLGYIYCDLKPENIMLTADGHVKLGDFGGARPVTDVAIADVRERAKSALTNMRNGDWRMRLLAEGASVPMDASVGIAAEMDVCDADCDAGEELDEGDDRYEGTPAYMSPELVAGDPPTAASDCWAYGCVLYFCLAGRPPVWGDSQREVMDAIASFVPDASGFPCGFDEDAADLILWLLRRDASERIGVAGAAVHAFFQPLAARLSAARRDVHSSEGVAAGEQQPIDLDSLIYLDAPRVATGIVAPRTQTETANPEGWARRQNSILWAATAASKRVACAPGTFSGQGVMRCLDVIEETQVEAMSPFLRS